MQIPNNGWKLPKFGGNKLTYRSKKLSKLLKRIHFGGERKSSYITVKLLKSKIKVGTSLVVQWLRIRLPVQRTRVWSLVREEPTCRGAAKPVRHSYWACALEPASHNYWARVLWLLKPACSRACMLQLLKPVLPEPMLCSKRSHSNERPAHRDEEWPLLATTRESPSTETKTQHSHK